MEKRRKTVFKIIILGIFTILAVMTTRIPTMSPAFAGVPGEHAPDAIWIEPSTVDLSTDTVSVGYRFNVTVWINLTESSVSWQFKLAYNKNHLNATGCGYTAGDKSQFFEDVTTIPLPPSFGSLNTTYNYVLHAESWMMGSVRGPGYGSLSWVEFEVVSVPPEGQTFTSTVALVEVYPDGTETYAQDPDGNKIPLNVFQCTYKISSPGIPPQPTTLTISVTAGGTTNPAPGSYTYPQDTDVTVTAIPDAGYNFDHWDLDGVTYTTNPITVLMDTNHSLTAFFTEAAPIVGTRLYVNPPNITDPTMTPSSTFTINITVDNVSDLTICEFNLTYDPAIITWMGATIFKVQNQIPTPKIILNDEAGFIWVQFTYPESITTESSPLLAILFHVDALGATILNLHDTQLIDSEGIPIDHTEEDGYFCTLIRDVAITNVFPSNNWTYVGRKLNITVVAKNKGDQNETFTVTAYYNDTQIGNIIVEDLPPQSETTLIFVWDTQNTTACSNYIISAQASTVPYELNTIDNKYIDGQVKIRILGDLNGDGKVLIDDVYLAVEAFASEPGHPRWNPDADINGDNQVRVDDVFWIALNFGKNCSP